MDLKGKLGDAINIASRVHTGQFDKSGEDYILHPLAVMRMVEGRKAKILAVLHDTREDYRKNPEAPFGNQELFENTLRNLFGGEIYQALDHLTHRPKSEETYQEYIERVSCNALATQVKIADLTHNMDPRRIPAGQIVDADFQRWQKYRESLIYLESVQKGK